MLAAGEDVVEKMNGGGTWEPMAAMDWLVGVDLTVTSMAYPLFGMVFTFLISVLWAQDFSLGTLGMIVVRPVARWKLFGAKALVSVAVLALALSLSILASALVSLPFLESKDRPGNWPTPRPASAKMKSPVFLTWPGWLSLRTPPISSPQGQSTL